MPKKESIIRVNILLAIAIFIISLYGVFVFSDVGIFSVSQQNTSLCNVQGYIIDAASTAVASSTNVTCFLGRNNGINSTYNTTTGTGFPTGSNNRYRCTMVCSNVIADNITVRGFNSTDNGSATMTMTGSTVELNITLTDYMRPNITGIIGNISTNVNTAVTIEINATDNVGIAGGNITLGNGTVINLSSAGGSTYNASVTTLLDDVTTINYTAIIYDNGDNNDTADTYFIIVADNVNPTANATVNQSSIDQDVNIEFNASNSSDNIGVTTYSWNFNDNSALNTSPVALHRFSGPGTYNISLTATDAAGNNGTAYVTVTVRDSTPPFVVSNIPTNGTANVSLKTEINITFNEFITSATLNHNNLDVVDEDDTKVYGNISFDSTLNKTIFEPYVLLKENKIYFVNLTVNIQDNSTNNLSSYIFNFTTKKRDTDNDGLPDDEETDDDNDGVTDAQDRILGNSTHIKTTITGINISFNSSTNLTNASSISGTYLIEINNGTAPIISFSADTTTTMVDLTNLSIYESDNESVGEIIVYGLNMSEGQTKTVYLTNKSNYNAVCIKDEPIVSITEISQACTSTNEFRVYCNGTTQSGYACTYNATINKFKVDGLNHSGLKEIDYDPTVVDQDDDGDGGEGGGGGGGGGTTETCLSNWVCEEWSECAPSGIQTRKCSDKNSCSPATGKPISSLYCVYIPLIGEEEQEEEIPEETEEEDKTEEAVTEIVEEEETEEAAETEQEEDLAGKAFDLIITNKANIYFLAFIAFIVLVLLVFHTVHDKKEQLAKDGKANVIKKKNINKKGN